MKRRAAVALLFLGISLILGNTLLVGQTERSLADGLVAYWSFDEGEGDIAFDATDNHNDATIHGATWVVGKTGLALKFDGVDDYVEAVGSTSGYTWAFGSCDATNQEIGITNWSTSADATLTDPNEADTDDDGLTDAEEAYGIDDYNGVVTAADPGGIKSDPTMSLSPRRERVLELARKHRIAIVGRRDDSQTG